VKIKFILILLALIVLVATQQPVSAAVTPAIDRWVFAGGGGTVTQGSYTLIGVTGQLVAGKASNGSSWLCSGILCGLSAYNLYLPLVLRSYP
jgi:hypothetical protein